MMKFRFCLMVHAATAAVGSLLRLLFYLPKQVKQRLMNYLANVTIPGHILSEQCSQKTTVGKNVNVCYC